MKKIFVSLLIACAVWPVAAAYVSGEIAADPCRSGGIYYAYPVKGDEAPAPPQGYEPVAISHYGRHGSRWAIKEWKYDRVLDLFSKARSQGNLTAEGERVAAMVRVLADDIRGNAGALTPLGEIQHKAIARRMVSRWPSLFADSATVRVFSSVEPRCIVSMAAFCEQLKETNPRLRILRKVAPGNIDFIAYSTDRALAAGSDTAVWRDHFNAWRDTVVKPSRLMSRLFKDPSQVKAPVFLMTLLHDIAVAEQNTEAKAGMLDIFTPEELTALWKALNYEMYVKHGRATVTADAGPLSAATLVRHFIDDADRRLAAGDCGVTLRFGHDTNLIRLLAFMGVEGCDAVESDPDRYHLAWQDYKVSPMGANLQLVFFRNKEGKVLCLARHNERPVHFPIAASDATGYYYDWQTLRSFLTARLENGLLPH